MLHFYVGLRSGRDRFLFFLLTMVLVAFAATGQVFAFSAMFKAYNVAYAVVLMIITITIVSIVARHSFIHNCKNTQWLYLIHVCIAVISWALEVDVFWVLKHPCSYLRENCSFTHTLSRML